MEKEAEDASASEKAEELAGFMARVLDSVPANVLMCDADLRIVAVNAAARAALRRIAEDVRETFGVEVEDVVGQPLQRFLQEPARVEAILGDPALLPHVDQLSVGSKVFQARINALRSPDGRVSGYAVVCEDVTRLRTTERELRNALRQRARLLREVRLRVKDSLRLAADLVRLDADEPDPAWAERLRAIDSIHERLCAAPDVEAVDLDAFVRDVVREAVAAHAPDGAKIAVETAASAEIRDLDRLLMFGLVLRELADNAARHGFAGGRSGHVRVTARVVDGLLETVISDDGAGMPKDQARRAGLGLKLVCALVEGRLKGSFKLAAGGAGGLACLFTFPL